MLAKKNRVNPTILGAMVIFALALALSGCTPAGPRALLKGKKFLDRGDNDDAVAELKTATTLLATNAQAWNYYGVALQGAGQPDEAANAYQRALLLDRDLMEAHYNLGWLWLEQNKPDAARTEFTAYTLRRPNDATGWLKLGSSQLRCGEPGAAEKSFSTALYLSPKNAEAYNGLGLVLTENGDPRYAARYFAAAIQFHPEYAPAYLNLAAISQEYLHDNAAALRNYQAYLAAAPHAANWSEVNAIVTDLERPAESVAAAPPAPALVPNVEAKPPTVASVRTYAPSRSSAAVPDTTAPAARTYSSPPPSHPAVITTAQAEQVAPEPAIVATPPPQPAVAPSATPSSSSVVIVGEVPPPQNSGFWHNLNPTRWFGSAKSPKGADVTGVTQLPSGTTADNSAPLVPPPAQVEPVVVVAPSPASAPVVSRPVKIYQPAAPVFPRYTYLSPARPTAGNHTAAAAAFAQAQQDEQGSLWTEAMESYGQAARSDPSWFEAQYDYGVLSYRLRDYSQALAAYEYALALQPDSTDARYNFALALKAAGFVTDAVNELKKVVAASPSEVRAHLALGNIYALQIHDVSRATAQYSKVLELDPNNSEAPSIRAWLASHPE
jgi:tetratricopeptide (TPR) repeat protein